MSQDPQPQTDSKETELAPEDFYYEGSYIVFTATYHLKRGYCCGSGCRHCPYEKSRDQEADVGDQ